MQELEKILEEINENTISLFSGVNMISAKKVEKILRNHINDGWIPVEEKPKKDYETVFAVDKNDYYFAAVYDKDHGFRSNDIGADVDNIVAYSLFNPYRPERSKE